MALWVLLVGIAAMPYSIRACHLFFFIFILNWAFEGGWGEKIKTVREHPYVLLFPLFVVLHLVGMQYTENIANGWANLDKKVFLAILPVAVLSSSAVSESNIRSILWVFISTCLLASVVCVVNSLLLAKGSGMPLNFSSETLDNYRALNPGISNVWMSFSYIALASGIGMHPTYLGLYLLFCFLLIAHLCEEKTAGSLRRKIAYYAVLGYLSLFIVFLSSRIITLGLTVAIFSLFLRHDWKNRTPRALLPVAISIGALVALVFINPVSRYRNLQEFSLTNLAAPATLSKNSLSIRHSLWWLSDRALADVNLWTGAGTGDVGDAMKEVSDRFNKKNILNTYDPHNQFLYTLTALGLPGLLTLLMILLLPVAFAFRKSKLVVVFFAIVTLSCFTESVLETQKGIIFISCFGPLLLKLLPQRRTSPVTLTYA